MVTGFDIPIRSETQLSRSPGVEPVMVVMESRSTTKTLTVDPIIKVAIARSVAKSRDALINISASDRSERPVRGFGALGDDVDHSSDRIRTPDGASRTPNNFDSLYVF